MPSRRCAPVLVTFLGALLSSCASDPPSTEGRGHAEDALASAVVARVNAQFQRRVYGDAGAVETTEPFFDAPWAATYERSPGGELIAVVDDEAPRAMERVAPARRERLAARLPKDASGGVHIDVDDEASVDDGVWLTERLVGGASESRAGVIDGRVVYPSAKRGVDRVYEDSSERVEEYLRLADASVADELTYEIETGPGIADVQVDGSGAGLVALDADGAPVLKAPQPEGVDADGDAVRGRLELSRLGAHRFAVRVALDGTLDAIDFPVLLDPGWLVVGSLGTARQAHAAARLQDGRVIVVGGVGSSGFELASAELYDPATGIWTATGSLTTARRYHTATSLPDGKVLVAGGEGTSVLASAELYDPATGAWTVTGPLATARRYHTAVPLTGGDVLVAGGTNPSVLSSAELYHPASATWSSAGALAIGRGDGHFAVRLLNGQVLVSGGSASATAELYDPATNTWSPTGSMSVTRRLAATALLPNGKVLVAGAIGSVGGIASAELYDPATKLWSSTAAMPSGRYAHSATALANGNVLVVGGIFNGGYPTTTERYDPTSGTWSSAGSIALGRYNHTATLLAGGNVLIAGGRGTAFAIATAQVYEPGLLGSPCAGPGNCGSGFCANGVCCNTACNAGPCEGCSMAVGAPTDGTCAALTGPVCNDGMACTHTDVCSAGTCGGTSYACTPTACQASSTCAGNGACTIFDKPNGAPCPDDGNPCTTDGCAAGLCTHTNLDDGQPCDAGLVCGAGACVAACFIDGGIVASGAPNPANACQACSPAVSTTTWSAADGVTCDDGDACTNGDACMAGNCVAGAPTQCVASDECHDAGTCAPATGVCSSSPKPDGTLCSAGTCEAGVCASGSASSSSTSASSSSTSGSSSSTSGSSSSTSGSSSSTSGSATGAGGGAASSTGNGGAGSNEDTGSGCGCEVVGDSPSDGSSFGGFAVAALALVVASRRKLTPRRA